MAEIIRKPHNGGELGDISREACTVENLEILAVRRAVIFASEIGLQQSHFEGDSETKIKALPMGDMFSSSFGYLVRDTLIHISSIRNFSFSHTIRQWNVVTHVLSQRARLSFSLLVWIESVLPNMDAFVFADFLAS